MTRVSLSAGPIPPRPTDARSLLAVGGAEQIVGGQAAAGSLAEPLAVRASTLFGPRGACLAAPDGPLYVCDTGHHRLLVWRRRPTEDHEPADVVIGQPHFEAEGRNGKQELSGATLNVPTGVACAAGVLAVADAWNHRVLIWHGEPSRSARPADVVIGQPDFRQGDPNRGRESAAADTLNWCYGVTLAGGSLIVADSGNRRVLVWERVPTANGTPADLVLGQLDFDHRDENGGDLPSAMSMRWPHSIAARDGLVCVADAGNNRILVWRHKPSRNGQACDAVIGQPNATRVDHNQAAYLPGPATLNMPYGLAFLDVRLVVADTANSRLTGFDVDAIETGIAARYLAAQPRFSDKGDNRWSAPTRDSLCWPYGVAATGDTLVVADSGNNRVLLWRTAERSKT